MSIDRRILRTKAKAEFKKLKKENPKQAFSFSAFYVFFQKQQRMSAVSGQIKELADQLKDSDVSLLDSMFSSDDKQDNVIEVTAV